MKLTAEQKEQFERDGYLFFDPFHAGRLFVEGLSGSGNCVER